MRIRGIDHVQLMSPEGSGPDARRFYGEVLGMAEVEPPDTLKGPAGTWFEIGNQQLHVSIDREFAPERSRRHFAVQVEDLNALRRRLTECGVPYQDDDRFPGYDRFYVKDPFGNRIEFLEPLAERHML